MQGGHVEIAAERPGDPAADMTDLWRGRYRHDPHERLQRHLDAARVATDVARQVEFDDLAFPCGHQRRIDAARSGIVDAIENARSDLHDADLEHVARFGTLDVDRAGQDMAAETVLAWQLRGDDRIRQHLIGRDARICEELLLSAIL